MSNLWIPNFDRYFLFNPTGKVAAKCLKLVLRTLWLSQKGDGMVSGRPIPEVFLQYIGEKLGFTPHVITIDDPPTEPLNLLQTIMDRPQILGEIRSQGSKHGWKIAPLISHPFAFDIGRAAALSVRGTSEEMVRAGLINTGNDKADFAQKCDELDIPRTRAWICHNGNGIGDVARQFLFIEAWWLVIRLARSAGGLGNWLFTSQESFLREFSKMNRHASTHPWATQQTLVEPFIPGLTPVSVVMKLDDDGPRQIATSLRMLNGLESVGCVIPAPRIRGLERAEELTMAYAILMWLMGCREVLDVDWGINEATGEVYAFESNMRELLTSIALNLGARYEALWAHPVVMIYDEAPLPEPPSVDHMVTLDAKLADLIHFANRAVWKTKNGASVDIVVVPLDMDKKRCRSFAFATIATDMRVAEAARAEFRGLIAQAAKIRRKPREAVHA